MRVPATADGVTRSRRPGDDGMVPRTKTVAALPRQYHPLHQICARPPIGRANLSFSHKFLIADLVVRRSYWSSVVRCNVNTLLEEESCAIGHGILVAVGLMGREISALGAAHPTSLLPRKAHCDPRSGRRRRFRLPRRQPPPHPTVLPLQTMSPPGTPLDYHLGPGRPTRWPLVLCMWWVSFCPPPSALAWCCPPATQADAATRLSRLCCCGRGSRPRPWVRAPPRTLSTPVVTPMMACRA